jgi:hypothetical protein
LKFDENNLNLVAIDRSKKLPKEELRGYEIELFPTIILFRNQEEIGQIVEIPNLSFEEDILALVTK